MLMKLPILDLQASVYRQFKDMNEFYSKMKELMGDDASKEKNKKDE